MSDAFIDTHAHPAAMPYYAMHVNEPIPDGAKGTVKVTSRTGLEKMTLQSLLEAVLKTAKKGGDVMIVCHGNDRGLLITIGRGKQGSAMLMTDSLGILERVRVGRISDTEAAATLFLDAAGFKKLKDLMTKLRTLNLNRVDIRACNCGAKKDTLEMLHAFFNCQTLCAPDLYDSYGSIAPVVTKDAKTWNKWMVDNPNATIEGTGDKRFGLSFTTTPGLTRINFDALAASTDAISAWSTAHMGASGGNAPPYHGFLQTSPLSLTFAGDPGFRSHLVQVSGAVSESGTLDVNAPLPR